MSSIKYIIFIFLVIIIILLSYLIITKTELLVDYKGMKQYNFLYPKSFIAKNIDKCPPGCVRGVCSVNNNLGNCQNDFQCSYCADEETNMFYVDFDNRGNILNNYDKNTNNKQTLTLNDQIEESNDYINDLNIHIRDINS